MTGGNAINSGLPASGYIYIFYILQVLVVALIDTLKTWVIHIIILLLFVMFFFAVLGYYFFGEFNTLINHFTPKLLRVIFELVRTPNIFSI